MSEGVPPAETPIDELANLASTFGQYARRTLNSVGPNPSSDSVFIREVNLAESRGWDSTEISPHAASVAGRLMLAAAVDNLILLGKVLADDRPGFVAFGPSRVSLECGSRAYWLHDPTIDLDSRSARFLALLLDDAWWRAKRRQESLQSGARINDLKQIGQAAGFPIKETTSGRALIEGVSVPSISESVGDAVEGGLGEAAYEYLSGIVHGNPMSLIEQASVNVGPDGATFNYELSTNVSALLLHVAMEATFVAVTARFDLFGWDKREWIETAMAAFLLVDTHLGFDKAMVGLKLLGDLDRL